MKISDLILAGAVAYGAYYLLKSKTAAPANVNATAPPLRYANAKQNPSTNGFLLFGTAAANALGAALGAKWPVQPGSTTTVDYSTQGNAIGDYAGLTQDQANQQATTDYNNQFISPWGQSDFAYNA